MKVYVHMKGASIILVRTVAGKLKIFPKKLALLAPCLHIMPEETQELLDTEKHYQQRYLDLMLHNNIKENFQTRFSKVTLCIYVVKCSSCGIVLVCVTLLRCTEI